MVGFIKGLSYWREKSTETLLEDLRFHLEELRDTELPVMDSETSKSYYNRAWETRLIEEALSERGLRVNFKITTSRKKLEPQGSSGRVAPC